MGTASSKAKVAAAAPLHAQGVQPKPAMRLGSESARAESKVAPMPTAGAMAGAVASPLTTPGGRAKRRRMVSIQNDAGELRCVVVHARVCTRVCARPAPSPVCFRVLPRALGTRHAPLHCHTRVTLAGPLQS